MRGELDRAMEYATQSISLAHNESDELTRLRAMLQQGSIYASRGELDTARAILDETLLFATVLDADVLALDVALEMAEAEVLHSGKIDRAEQSLKVADLVLEKPGTPTMPLREARLLEKRGGARLNLEHRCAEGLAYMEKALERREEAIAEQSARGLSTVLFERLAADALLNIANAKLFALTGYWGSCVLQDVEQEQVLNDYHDARKRFIDAIGNEQHLGLAEYEFSIAAALLQFGHSTIAIKHFASALSIYRAHHGPQSLLVGDAHRALTEAYRQSGDLAKARFHAAANVEIRELHRGQEGQQLTLAEAYDALGVILYQLEEVGDASIALHEAADVLATSPISAPLTLNEHEQLRLSHINLALVELTLATDPQRGEWSIVSWRSNVRLRSAAGPSASTSRHSDWPRLECSYPRASPAWRSGALRVPKISPDPAPRSSSSSQ